MIELDGDRLRVTGSMTIESAAALMAAGEVAVHSGGASLIDLSAVEDADSSALAVLFGWLRAAEGRSLTVVQAPASLRSLAILYGVAELLPLA